MIAFDATINLGTVLSAVAIVSTMIGSYNRFIRRLERMETKVNVLWTELQRTRGADPRIQQFFGVGDPE